MNRGFYVVMAAQFVSSLADNAMLIAAIALLQELHAPDASRPMLKLFFFVSYVVLAAFVGAFADSMPKGRVMFLTNAVKLAGGVLMFLGVHPAVCLRGHWLWGRGLLAGQVRHRHGVAAAGEAGRGQRLDRGPHGRIDRARLLGRRLAGLAALWRLAAVGRCRPGAVGAPESEPGSHRPAVPSLRAGGAHQPGHPGHRRALRCAAAVARGDAARASATACARSGPTSSGRFRWR